ncbi:unnamed protein product [Brugia timori]|uniref:Uncharacterized protein n=1 Tax=Brugia timori TaxID=42155 RepID=A0A0R3QT30_9BILA|nr:unnamed protein product [Brugia timori]
MIVQSNFILPKILLIIVYYALHYLMMVHQCKLNTNVQCQHSANHDYYDNTP